MPDERKTETVITIASRQRGVGGIRATAGTRAHCGNAASFGEILARLYFLYGR